MTLTNLVFLESTINADRHFSDIKRQVEIKRNLEGKRLYTSKYVIGELKNNFLKNAITFYNLLVEEEGVLNALRRLSSIIYSKRQYDRIIKLFAYLAEKVELDKAELLERLDILIEDSMEVLFTEDIEEVIDQCNCVRAAAKPIKEGKRWILDIGCRQNPKPPCSIESFIDENHLNFSKITKLDELKETLIAERLTKMLNNEIKKYGTNCWKIGDSVIGMELPDELPIYTSNKKDFKPICEALGKQLYKEEDFKS